MSEFSVKFRGVRGSYPIADKDYLQYGGNTSCVEVNVGGHRIILDGGTGIISLGDKIFQEHISSANNVFDRKPMNLTMLLSHVHQDHIQGLNFFKPMNVITPELTITAKVHFQPHEKIMGERAGLLIMGLDYAAIMLEKTGRGVEIYSTQCIKANKGTAETQQDRQAINTEWVYLKVQIADEKARFAYSTDNKQYISLGDEFILKEGVWIGAKYGFVCTRPPLSSLKTRNDGGNIDIDYLEINYK